MKKHKFIILSTLSISLFTVGIAITHHANADLSSNGVTYLDKTTSKGELGVDVSDTSNQRDLTSYAEHGATFAVIRTSQYGDWLLNGRYGSDNAKYQVESAKQNGMHIMAYHGSRFGNSNRKAIEEANYAVSKAIKYGIPKGSYLACDYETGAVDDKKDNTDAIQTFMEVVEREGYKPLVYTGIKYAKNYIDTQQLEKRFGKCIWLAQYPNGNDVATAIPNIEKLEKLGINGVAMYQFTNRWHGDKVDGNVTNIDLKNGD